MTITRQDIEELLEFGEITENAAHALFFRLDMNTLAEASERRRLARVAGTSDSVCARARECTCPGCSRPMPAEEGAALG